LSPSISGAGRIVEGGPVGGEGGSSTFSLAATRARIDAAVPAKINGLYVRRLSSIDALPPPSADPFRERGRPEHGPILLYPTSRDTAPGDSPRQPISPIFKLLHSPRQPVSPIFKLLRSSTTVNRARKLLMLESKISKLKNDRDGLDRQLLSCDSQIEKIEEDYDKVMKERKEHRSKEEWEKFAQKQVKHGLMLLERKINKERAERKNALDRKLHKRRITKVDVDFKKKKAAAIEQSKTDLAPLVTAEEELAAKEASINEDRKNRLLQANISTAMGARLLDDENKREKRASIEQDFATKMVKHMSERVKREAEIKAERKKINDKLRNDLSSIQDEYDREVAIIKTYVSECKDEYKRLELEASITYKEEEIAINRSGADILEKVQADESKIEAEKDQAIADQNQKIEDLEQAQTSIMSEIDEVRTQISATKGQGQREDPLFDINSSRDAFENTFLIVAAQRNDFKTAEICFQLGASPNEANVDGLSAMLFAEYFSYTEMISLLSRHGASSRKLTFQGLLDAPHRGIGDANSIDWESQLRISEQAAIPADTFFQSAEELDNDEESRMSKLSPEEQQRDYSCFEARLLDPNARSKWEELPQDHTF